MKQFACSIKPKQIIKDKAQPIKSIIPEKTIIVLDVFGTPLEGVHIIGSLDNTITDQGGKAMISSNGSEEITFSHVGKITQKIPFSKLGNVVTMKDAIENLDEVIIQAVKPKKSNLWIWGLGIGAALLLLSKSNKSKPKPVNL